MSTSVNALNPIPSEWRTYGIVDLRNRGPVLGHVVYIALVVVVVVVVVDLYMALCKGL